MPWWVVTLTFVSLGLEKQSVLIFNIHPKTLLETFRTIFKQNDTKRTRKYKGISCTCEPEGDLSHHWPSLYSANFYNHGCSAYKLLSSFMLALKKTLLSFDKGLRHAWMKETAFFIFKFFGDWSLQWLGYFRPFCYISHLSVGFHHWMD